MSRTFLYVQSIVFVLVKARAKKRVHELASYLVFFCWNAYLCSHLQVVERWPAVSSHPARAASAHSCIHPGGMGLAHFHGARLSRDCTPFESKPTPASRRWGKALPRAVIDLKTFAPQQWGGS